MRIKLILFLILCASLLSVITSGLEQFVALKFSNSIVKYTTTPIGLYLIGYCLILYIIFKLKFKRLSTFKFYYLRKVAKFKGNFKKMDIKVYYDKIKLNSLQEKSINTWNSLVKDRGSNLQCSLSTYDRSVQKDGILLILKSTSSENILTYINTGEVNVLFEIFIPQGYAKEIATTFDIEQSKRICLDEHKKRKYIESLIC